MADREYLKRVKYEPIKRTGEVLTFEKLVDDRAMIAHRDFEPHERALIEITFLMSEKENINKKRKDKKTTRFIHPWNVARILARYGVDYITLCAGLLHDSIEDAIDRFIRRYHDQHDCDPDDSELEAQETRLLARLEEKLITEFRKRTYTPYLLYRMNVAPNLIPRIYRDITTFIRSVGMRSYLGEGEEGCHPTDAEFGRKVRELMRLRSHQASSQFRLDVDDIDYQLRERQSTEDAARLTEKLMQKYDIHENNGYLLYTLNIMHFNIERIIDIDEALTRKKSKYYPESINYMFDHTHDVRLKLRTTMVKLSDRCHNVQDLNPNVFNFLQRLTNCFKNIYVQTRTVKFLLEWKTPISKDPKLEEYYRRAAVIYNDCAYFTWVELDKLVNELTAIISPEQNRTLRARLQRYEYEKEGLETRTDPLQLQDARFDNVSNEFLEYMYSPKEDRSFTALGQTWFDQDGKPLKTPNYERIYEYALAHRAVASKLRWAWQKGYYVKGLADLAQDMKLQVRQRSQCKE